MHALESANEFWFYFSGAEELTTPTFFLSECLSAEFKFPVCCRRLLAQTDKVQCNNSKVIAL